MSELVPEISYAGVHHLFVPKRRDRRGQEEKEGRRRRAKLLVRTNYVENWMVSRLLEIQLWLKLYNHYRRKDLYA